jgi:hypothetical protein
MLTVFRLYRSARYDRASIDWTNHNKIFLFVHTNSPLED